MARKLIDALLIVALVCTGTVAAGQDRDRDRDHRDKAAALKDCCTPGDEDFPKVGGNLGNQNYSALRQINKARVRRLGGAWLNKIEGGLTTGTNQSTPVVVDGTIYIESALGNVIAVDGKTGVTQWKYTQVRGNLTRRGVAVGQGLVFTLSGDDYVVALDRKTGALVWERRHDGFGNVEKVAIVYYAGKLLVGTNDSDRCAALALNATTGDLIWHFWGAPGPGEFGNDTWEGDSWMEAGACPWIHPAIDPDLGTVYFTFGNVRAGSSQDGSTRGGDNLFANSIVALDVETGAYKWHFQSIHHDIWDMDNVMAPVLVNAKIRGHKRKLVVYGSKSGMYFISRSARRQRATRNRRGSGSAGTATEDLSHAAVSATGWLDRELRGRSTARNFGSRQSKPRGSQLRARLPVCGALGRSDPLDSRTRRWRGLESSLLQSQHRPRLHGLRLCRVCAFIDGVQQRPQAAG